MLVREITFIVGKLLTADSHQHHHGFPLRHPAGLYVLQRPGQPTNQGFADGYLGLGLLVSNLLLYLAMELTIQCLRCGNCQGCPARSCLWRDRAIPVRLTACYDMR
jgi:hypothetical protein